MSEAASLKQHEDVLAALVPSVAKVVERFVKTSKYESPKVASFSLSGLQETGVTSMTGNT